MPFWVNLNLKQVMPAEIHSAVEIINHVHYQETLSSQSISHAVLLIAARKKRVFGTFNAF